MNIKQEITVNIKALALTALTLVLPHTGFSQDFEKNGLPCVAEICLGDGIAEMSKVKWDRTRVQFSTAANPTYTSVRKVSEAELQFLTPTFKGDLAQSAAFLYENLFDDAAFQSLENVKASCDKNTLFGTYTTPNGNPTSVGISLVSDLGDNSTQRWKVVSISRTFPGAVSIEQEEKVNAELKSRYRVFGAGGGYISKPKAGEGRYVPNIGSKPGFRLWLFNGYDELNRRKLHPSCGGSERINID